MWSRQILHIKRKVEEIEGIPPEQQRLVFAGKQMCPDTHPPPALWIWSTLDTKNSHRVGTLQERHQHS